MTWLLVIPNSKVQIVSQDYDSLLISWFNLCLLDIVRIDSKQKSINQDQVSVFTTKRLEDSRSSLKTISFLFIFIIS